jgi:cyclophilin family peptidyl-prolyl cis-trans isomerase
MEGENINEVVARTSRLLYFYFIFSWSSLVNIKRKHDQTGILSMPNSKENRLVSQLYIACKATPHVHGYYCFPLIILSCSFGIFTCSFSDFFRLNLVVKPNL